MVKINVYPAAREITEHYASGEHSRAFDRASIAAAMPAYLARMGGMPRYDYTGAPVNPPAVKATAERKARLEARAAENAARNAAAKAARIAAAEKLAAEYTASIAAEMTDDSEYGFDTIH